MENLHGKLEEGYLYSVFISRSGLVCTKKINVKTILQEIDHIKSLCDRYYRVSPIPKRKVKELREALKNLISYSRCIEAEERDYVRKQLNLDNIISKGTETMFDWEERD